MYLCLAVMGVGIIGFCICKSRNYREWQKSSLVCIGIAVLALFVGITEQENDLLDENGYLNRSPVGEGVYDVELVLGMEGREERSFLVNVPEQLLTTEEERYYLESALVELENEFRDEEGSLKKITGKYEIRETYQNGIVHATWDFSNPKLVESDGTINEEMLSAECEEVYVTVTLTCGESQLLHTMGTIVCEREKSEEEILEEKIYAIIQEDGKKKGTTILQLPQEVNGLSLAWKTKKSQLPQQILFLGILIAVLLPELEREKQREQKKKREEQLLCEYPEMVNKLTL